jgi:hypothetical protein
VCARLCACVQPYLSRIFIFVIPCVYDDSYSWEQSTECTHHKTWTNIRKTTANLWSATLNIFVRCTHSKHQQVTDTSTSCFLPRHPIHTSSAGHQSIYIPSSFKWGIISTQKVSIPTTDISLENRNTSTLNSVNLRLDHHILDNTPRYSTLHVSLKRIIVNTSPTVFHWPPSHVPLHHFTNITMNFLTTTSLDFDFIYLLFISHFIYL